MNDHDSDDSYVITIDGPSGSGKGTISRRVARALGYHLLDSGALYRLLALAATRRGIELDDAAAERLVSVRAARRSRTERRRAVFEELEREVVVWT